MSREMKHNVSKQITLNITKILHFPSNEFSEFSFPYRSNFKLWEANLPVHPCSTDIYHD